MQDAVSDPLSPSEPEPKQVENAAAMNAPFTETHAGHIPVEISSQPNEKFVDSMGAVPRDEEDDEVAKKEFA